MEQEKKSNRTELVFILDRSGSMGGLESDTIGGFNSTLEKQKQLEGEARVTTVLFDDKYEILHDRIPVNEVRPLTDEDYYVRGCTALLDAVGRTIDRVVLAQKASKEEYRADKVMFVIITDGLENASRKYSYGKVKMMIEARRELGWEFMFLGANIDAAAEAERLGIARERAARYCADKAGTRLNFKVVSEAMCCLRDAFMPSDEVVKHMDSLLDKVREDYKRRSK
jgi:uncharacterized protein YegL